MSMVRNQYIPLMQTPSNPNTRKLMNLETFTTCKTDLDVVISAVWDVLAFQT